MATTTVSNATAETSARELVSIHPVGTMGSERGRGSRGGGRQPSTISRPIPVDALSLANNCACSCAASDKHGQQRATRTKSGEKTHKPFIFIDGASFWQLSSPMSIKNTSASTSVSTGVLRL